MTADERKPKNVRIYLCECGPIIKEKIDLDALADRLRALPGITEVVNHATMCAGDGLEMLAADLAAHPDCRVVVAGCSPREHGTTFMEACRKAGFNPYLLAVANMREQCAWVTPDAAQALEKAERIVAAAVARVREQQPLEERELDCRTDALVVGAGPAGLTAARMLADAGRKVVLVERSPAVGGKAALIGEVYPDLECGSCMLQPLMDAVLHHPGIETLTCSEVEEVLGDFGNFTVRIRKKARHADPAACYGCGTCQAACPVKVASEWDPGLAERSAAFVPYNGALPNAVVIDEENCLKFQGRECNACADACPFGNIDLQETDTVVERQAGAVILATGAEARLADADVLAPRIITAGTLERVLNPSGPTGGEFHLPGVKEPRSVVLVHCADEKGHAPAEACSRVCCMAFARYAHTIVEKAPGCEVTQVLWDRCTGGKGYREFFNAATRAERIRQIRLGPGDEVTAVTGTGEGVKVSYTREGLPAELNADLAVIAPPLGGSAAAERLAGALRLERGERGFFIEEHEHLRSFATRREGVYTAGCAQSPKNIQESTAQGAAAAGAVLSALVPGRKLRVEPAVAAVDAEQCGACRTCVLTCPYQAVAFDDDQGAAEVNGLLCRGCGTCAAACPAGAITARHFSDRQLDAETAALTIQQHSD